MENKCPHCGKPMPKSSAFCMHCMQGIGEKDALAVPHHKSKKSVVLVCALVLVILLSGGIAFAAIRHRTPALSETEAADSVNVIESSVSSTAASVPSTAKKQAKTTKKQAAKKATTAKETAAPPATQAPEQPTYAPEQPQTKPAPTAADNEVVIQANVLSDYPNGKTDSSYTIPYDVTSISANAFHGNTHLRALKFSKRTNVSCNWSNLFANLPNLETIYIYTGTSADTQGMQ